MKKILVVDELQALSKIYVELLLKDFLVEASDDPKEITPRTMRFRPHLLIVNADLPHLNAEEVCNLAKGKFQIPILLLVGKSSAKTIAIDGCHADAILTRPFDNKVLLDAVQQLIGLTS